jgi:hypothetical protein
MTYAVADNTYRDDEEPERVHQNQEPAFLAALGDRHLAAARAA